MKRPGLRPTGPLLAGVAAAVLAAVAHWPIPGVSAQAPAPAIRILTPTEHDAVRGPVSIQAAIDPEDTSVRRVTLYGAGQPVCELTEPPWRCDWDAGPEAGPRHIRAVGELESGERLTAALRTAAGRLTFRARTDAVLVGVGVRDRRGRFVTGLTRDAFQLHVDGEPRPIEFFAPEGWPAEVVLALDMSASMALHMDDVRLATRAFLDALRPDDVVTMTAFNTSLYVLSAPGASAADRYQAVERLRPWGGTAFYDAVVSALDLLRQPDRRRAIVAFTDGDDRSSRARPERVGETLLSDNALLYVVAYGEGAQAPETRMELERVTAATGGRAFFLDRIEDMAAAFRSIVGELGTQYTLGFGPDADAEPGEWRSIRIELQGGRYDVRAREGYVTRRPAP